MKKRILSLIAAVACLMSTTGVGAIEANTVVTDAGNGNINVATDITGTNAGDKISYLAYDNSEGQTVDTLTDEDIVYIDTKTAETEPVTFTYVTASNSLGSAVMADTSNMADDNIALSAISGGATVTISDGETTYYQEDSYATQVGAGENLIPFTLSEAVVVESVEIDGVATDLWYTGADNQTLWIAEQAFGTKLNGVDPVAVTIVTATNPATSALTLGMNHFSSRTVATENGNVTGESVVALGNVAGDAAEFGMLIAATEAGVAGATGLYSKDGNVYPALGKNKTGDYAIQLIDTANALPEYVYARAYFKDGSGNYTYANKTARVWNGGITDFAVGGHKGVIDSLNKTITVDIPMWNATGGSIDITNMDMDITTKTDVNEILFGAETLAGSGKNWTKSGYNATKWW